MPEIIDTIVKSELDSLPTIDGIRKDSDQFAKLNGKKYKLIPCKKSDYKNFIRPGSLKRKGFYRIQALKSFSDVKKGDIGGIIDDSSFLSHKGNCWIYNNAIVKNNSYVINDSIIKDTSCVNESFIENTSKILGDCFINHSNIINSTLVTDDAVIENSDIDGKSEIRDFSYIKDSICRDLHIGKHITLFHCLTLSKKPMSGIIDLENCKILENASIKGYFSANNCIFTSNAEIDLNTDINEYSSHIIGTNAKIRNDKDFLTINGFGVNRVPITFFNCNDNKIRCIINNNFCGEISEAEEFVMENAIEEYDGEFDDIIKYVKKKLNYIEEK